MTTYTRLTLIGNDRRADMVVPDGEPIAAVLPDILQLLDHAPGPIVLVTRTGDRLDTDRTLAEQDIADGTPLWVTAIDSAPPPAQVTDITDLTAHTHDTRADAWNPRWATAVAVPVVAALAFLASRELAPVAGVSVLVGLVAAGCLLGRLGKASLAALSAAAGAGLAVQTAVMLPADDPAWLVALAAFGLVAAVVALVGVVGFGDRALGAGGAAGALLVLAVFAIVEAGASTVNAAATVAAAGLVILGIAPGIAMTASGLTGLDDRLVTGHDTPRTEAHAGVNMAYRSLTWLTLAAVIVTAVCATVTAGSTSWGRWLATAVAVVLVLRMRVLPLAPQRIALVAGALGVVVALLTGMDSGPATTASIVLGLCVVATVAARPSPVVVARLNRAADFAETLAVVALVPLLLALWGVFGDLARAF